MNNKGAKWINNVFEFRSIRLVSFICSFNMDGRDPLRSKNCVVHWIPLYIEVLLLDSDNKIKFVLKLSIIYCIYCLHHAFALDSHQTYSYFLAVHHVVLVPVVEYDRLAGGEPKAKRCNNEKRTTFTTNFNNYLAP